MRSCPTCGANFAIISGIWQCPACHAKKNMPVLKCQDCGKIFVHEYEKRPIPCPYCGSYSTRMMK